MTDFDESTFQCEYFNTNECKPDKAPCPITETCPGQKGMKTACYAVWSNDTVHGVKVRLKGCWLAQDGEYNNCGTSRCIAEKTTTKFYKDEKESSTYFCCCSTKHCNENISYAPLPFIDNHSNQKGTLAVSSTPTDALSLFSYAFVPIFILTVIILAVYYLHRRCKLKNKTKETARTESSSISEDSSSPGISFKSIELLEKIANGRFGIVCKAKAGPDQFVAVKKFPPNDVESWEQEQAIYTTPGMREHPNILYYLGSDVRGSGSDAEYWLITKYQENGSVYEYLKTHTVTLTELLQISIGMLRGLVFLHEEICVDNQQTSYKPAIVHRDFKSKNVLLDGQLNACISDFGLAMRCEHGRSPNSIHNQVGTRRYMAPEVLQAAQAFDAKAFREVDVYAAALVLWEILSRCSYDEEKVDDYKQPFDEIGPRPSLEEMQAHVVVNNLRPELKDKWRQHKQMGLICSTIEEMWDKEPEARISAHCALARYETLQTNISNASAFQSPPSMVKTGNEIQMSAERSPLISEYDSLTTFGPSVA